MSTTVVIVALSTLLVLVVLAGLALRRRRTRPLRAEQYFNEWRRLQKRCADKSMWSEVIVDADELVDDVLKKLHYKGKNTGERLVAAQHALSDNEGIWFGHKLRNRITQDHLKKVSKQDTLEALSGFRQALKDLGAWVDQSSELTEPKE